MSDWTKGQPIHRITRCEKENWANQIIRSGVSAMESQGRYEETEENDLSSNLSHVVWLYVVPICTPP